VEKFKTEYAPFVMNGLFASRFIGITTLPGRPFAEISASLLQPLGPSLNSLLIIFSGSSPTEVAPNYSELLSLLNQMTNVKHLGFKFYRWSPISEEERHAIRISLPNRPSLKELEFHILSDEIDRSSTTFMELVLQKYGSQLEKLACDNGFAVSFDVNNVNLSNLSYLELRCSHTGDWDSFMPLSQWHLSSLRVLVLKGAHLFMSVQFLNLLQSLRNTLEELHLASNLWPLEEDPRELGVLPKLKKLVINKNNLAFVRDNLFVALFSNVEEIRFEPGPYLNLSSLNVSRLESLFPLYLQLKRVVWMRNIICKGGLRIHKETVVTVTRPKIQGI